MEEVIRALGAHGVRYLVIGGQAVRLEGLPRFSMDWDLYIPPRDEPNLAKINEILADALDVPLLGRGPRGENSIQTYQTRWGILQFHLGGPGLPPFDEAERDAVTRRLEDGTSVRCLSGRHLLKSKEAADRPQDRQDIDFLRAKLEVGLL